MTRDLQSFFSQKTGFLHFCKEDLSCKEVIPLVENFFFAVFLLQQKTVKSTQQAKVLLERLFAFQTEEGNFPSYLHEYPYAKDCFVAVGILQALCLLRLSHQSIFQEAFLQRVEEVEKKLLSSLESFDHFSVKTLRFIYRHSENIDKELGFLEDNCADFTSSKWNAVLPSLVLLMDQKRKAKDMVQTAYSLIQQKREGCLREMSFFQEGLSPTFASYYFSLKPPETPSALYASCFPKKVFSEEVFVPCSVQKKLLGERSAYYFPSFTDAPTKNSYCLYIPLDQGSFVVPASHGFSIQEDGEKLLLEAVLEKEQQCSLFICRKNTSFQVQDRQSTLCREKELLCFYTQSEKIQICFSSDLDGVLARIHPGNRPSQTDHDRFAAYDWKISFFRPQLESSLRLQIHWELSVLTPMACMPLST